MQVIAPKNHKEYNSENIHLHQTRRTLENIGLQQKEVRSDMMSLRALEFSITPVLWCEYERWGE